MLKKKEILFIIIIWIVAGLLINWAAGFIAQNKYMYLDLIDHNTAQSSEGYFVPNQDKTLLFPGLKPYHVKINDLGLRWVGHQQTKESINLKPKVMCLGDSNTFGLFADNEASYPYQLQEMFKKVGKDVEILNASIGSLTISDVLYYLKIKGLALKPDVALLSYSHNDVTDIERKEPLYEKVKNERNPGIMYTLKNTNIARALRQVYVQYKYQRWLQKVNDPKAKLILKEEFKNVDDLLYVSKSYHVGKEVWEPHAEELKPLWKQYLAILGETVDLLQDHDIKVVFYIHPEILSVFDQANASYEEILIDFLQKRNVETINVLSKFKDHKEEIVDLYVNPPRDFHLSGKGNKIVSQLFFEKIKDWF